MMRDFFKKFGVLSILILSTVILISWYYGEIIIAPNQILFNATGDGLKNYYVPMMQVGSDQYFMFEYFNYPYGEHFFIPMGFQF